MTHGESYAQVMARRDEIVRRSVGLDYARYATGAIAFDYERLLADTGYDLESVRAIQGRSGVGSTPLIELPNLTRLVRATSEPGRGARLFVKDEAANPSGSFKDRRASVSVHEAREQGFEGVVAATSGNYGAAVASQAARAGLRCIVVQEAFDARGVAQPEIAEKTRACEATGAEVLRLSVGPELFSVFLSVLEETGFFNASLYTPYSIVGIETLGFELVQQMRETTGGDPDMVIVTHAGGGNLTGTARGLARAGAAATRVVAASVDLSGLHMASDRDFNRKSFTTGHTGFSIPFTTWPDRADVPRNAARALRYMNRFVTVTQGEVFYATEALSALEGLERGPAGNTSLAAALALARELDEDRTVVVQETEYTGAGKHPLAQLAMARRMGVRVERGDPRQSRPGESIRIPERPEQIRAVDVDLDGVRRSYLQNALSALPESTPLQDVDVEFLAAETRWSPATIRERVDEMRRTTG